jgi:hypothetical protein
VGFGHFVILIVEEIKAHESALILFLHTSATGSGSALRANGCPRK